MVSTKIQRHCEGECPKQSIEKRHYGLLHSVCNDGMRVLVKTVLFFSLFFILFSCQPNKNKQNPVDSLLQITQKGEINVLTLSGSMSYFIYKGEPKGYEYELLSNFAESLNLNY